MVSAAANDYLTKQLSIAGNIVTFRSLSRELGMHVNVAKNELASYHASNASSSCATYLLSGQVSVLRKDPYGMETDLNMKDDDNYDDYGSDDEGLELTQSKTLVVSESQLEATQSEFVSPPSIQIYSLSPAPLKDGGLLCTPTLHLRAIDLRKEVENAKDAEATTKQRNDWAKVVGKIIGDNVSFKPSKRWSASKIKPAGPVVVPSKSASSTFPTTSTAAKKDTINADPQPKAAEKSKATGKLDWSNAKTKDQKAAVIQAPDAMVKKGKPEKKVMKHEEIRVMKEEAKKKEEQIAKERETVKAEVSKDDHKKRARALLSDSDSDTEALFPARLATKSRIKSKGKRPVAFSSDGEDSAPEAKGRKRLVKGKKTEKDEKTNASLRAMMDSDDDQVIRISRLSTSTPASIPPTDDDLVPSEDVDDQPVSADTDVDMDGDMDIVKPQPKKRKPKKVIPIGRNGLKKRRVQKSRTKEENGYMVTEDFSSYESVDEEVEPAPPKSKIQAKTKPEAKKVKRDEVSKSKPSGSGGLKPAPSAKIKSTGSGSWEKGGIANFFTKK